MEMAQQPIVLTRLVEPTTRGNKQGNCIFCMLPTQHGFPLSKISKTFTDWNYAYQVPQPVVCEYCYSFLKNENVRRRSWVITQGQLRLLDRRQVLQVLQEPPQPPFAIYVALKGKKHGWLRLLHKIATNKEQYYIAIDDALLYIDRTKIKEYVKLLQEARKQGAKKSELEELNVGLIKKIGLEKYRELQEKRRENEEYYMLVLRLID